MEAAHDHARGQQLLLPVNPSFIGASLLLALAINLLPLGPMWSGCPMLIPLACWGVHQPWRVGMGIGFLLGLCMDVHQSSCWVSMRWPYTVLILWDPSHITGCCGSVPGSSPCRWWSVRVAHAVLRWQALLAGRAHARVVGAGAFVGICWPVVSWICCWHPSARSTAKDKRAQ